MKRVLRRMQNFNDILNGVTDGTKNLSISALTCAGTATLNGDVNIGDASADTLTILASLGGTIPVKTDVTYDLGSTSKRMQNIYAKQYYGIPTNTAVGSGFIGEVVSSTGFGGAVDLNNALVALGSLAIPSAGNWLLFAALSINGTDGATNYAEWCVGTTSASSAGTTVGLSYFTIPVASATDYGAGFCMLPLSLSGATTYYLNAKSNQGDSGVGGGLGSLIAVRVG